MQQWQVRIHGKPRREVDKILLIQAVIALGKQLTREAQDADVQEVHEGERREGAC
jgi:hypothetical protein